MSRQQNPSPANATSRADLPSHANRIIHDCLVGTASRRIDRDTEAAFERDTEMAMILSFADACNSQERVSQPECKAFLDEFAQISSNQMEQMETAEVEELAIDEAIQRSLTQDVNQGGEPESITQPTKVSTYTSDSSDEKEARRVGPEANLDVEILRRDVVDIRGEVEHLTEFVTQSGTAIHRAFRQISELPVLRDAINQLITNLAGLPAQTHSIDARLSRIEEMLNLPRNNRESQSSESRSSDQPS